MECGMKRVVFRTSFGWAGVAATERGICMIVLPKKEKKVVEREMLSSESGVRSSERSTLSSPSILGRAVKLLKRYFSGECVPFDLPLDLGYYTAFQQAVWNATAEIPYGETRSYAWIAKRVKKPKAARAVGQAMGANPIPIIVP